MLVNVERYCFYMFMIMKGEIADRKEKGVGDNKELFHKQTVNKEAFIWELIF